MNNIRHILLTVMMALMSSLSAWAVSTVDKLYLSPTTLTPGETETQYVSLVILGNRRYSAYNLDVTIPEGVELAYDEGEEDVYFDNNCIIPYSKGNPKHQLAATYTAEDRNLRISCVSTTNAEFTSESGVVCYIGLVVSTYAKPGALSINLSGQALTTADGTQYGIEGKVTKMSGVIDAGTGSVQMIAVFPNPDKVLKSGGSGAIMIPHSNSTAIIIPQGCVSEVQDKKFVYILDKDNKVKYSEIKVDPQNDGSNYVVLEGLKTGDKYVTNGITKLSDGMEIVPITPEKYQQKIKDQASAMSAGDIVGAMKK